MMEANKDEALRALEIAEKKFAVRDYAAAKKLLLKAQQLYPAFENVLRMLAVVEVHTIAQEKAPGSEIDWYQLLQVDFNADDSTIKKSYRRLALMLHPDKNKSPGAEAAFKLIGEAWAVLSDKAKRLIYDGRRMLNGKDVKSNSFRKGEDGHSTQFPNQVPSRTEKCAQNNNVNTFWTSCPDCKMQYEYYRTYLNFNLKCQKCNKIFVARDIYGRVPNDTNRSNTWSSEHTPNFQSGFYTQPAGSKVSASGTTQAKVGEPVNGAPTSGFSGRTPQKFSNKVEKDLPSSRSERRRNVKQSEGQEDERRKAEAEQKEKVKSNAKKQQTIDILLMKKNLLNQTKRKGGYGHREVEEPQSGKRSKTDTRSGNNHRQKVGTEHQKELNKLNASPDSRHRESRDSGNRRSTRRKRTHYKEEDEEEDEEVEEDGEDDDFVAFSPPKRQTKAAKCASAMFEKVDTSQVAQEKSKEKYVRLEHCDDLDSSDVPDADFHNFDQDRAMTNFNAGQFWALYDDFDGMPRFYCHIISVSKGIDFAVRMRWLEALPESREFFGGLSPPYGKFRCARQAVTEKEINVFSHMMRPDVDCGQPINIYPRTGEIWALFKDLSSPVFESLASDQGKGCKYEIIEVRTNLTEEMGVNIVSLVKVDGYRTVFGKKSNAAVQWLSPSELSRFSHLVPSWKIVEEQVAFKGFVEVWDLDPAALSLDLINRTAERTGS